MDYYVTSSGGTGAGTIGDPWSLSYAFGNAVAGDTVHIKAGTYNNFVITQSANGTAVNPIIFKGYKTTINDVDEDAQEDFTLGPKTIQQMSSFAYLDTASASEIPLLNKAYNPSDLAAIRINGNYVHLYNVQFTNYNRAIWVQGDNCIMKNLICIDQGPQNIGTYAGEGGRNVGNNNTWKNLYVENSGAQSFTVQGSNSTYDGVTIVSSNSGNPTDYGFLIQGGSGTITGNVITNIFGNRPVDLVHYGRGICFKSNADTYNNTISDFIIYDTVLEVSGDGTHDNLIQDGYMNTFKISDSAPGIRCSNGSYDNNFENIHSKGHGPYFTTTYTNYDSLVLGSSGNIFNQCTFDFTGSNYDGISFGYFDATGGFTQPNDNNTFYNCTFYNGNNLFENSRANSNTQFINCIFDDFTGNYEQTRAGSPGYTVDVSYSSVNFTSLNFSTPTGTNITTVTPGFVDAANGNFEVTHATLLGAGIATPYLSVGNNIGAVQNQGDILAPSVTQITVSNILDDIFKVSWNLDEASKGSIEYGTSTGVYTNNTPLRNQFSTSFVEEVGATIPLQSNTTYYWRIRTEDVTGNIGYSTEQNTTTISQLLRNNKPIGFGAGPIVKAYIGAINVIK